MSGRQVASSAWWVAKKRQGFYLVGAHALDRELESRLLRLHKRLGLFYGAYDLIVDQEGNYYFLEVNPAGQWSPWRLRRHATGAIRQHAKNAHGANVQPERH
jgi:hypothetical protein